MRATRTFDVRQPGLISGDPFGTDRAAASSGCGKGKRRTPPTAAAERSRNARRLEAVGVPVKEPLGREMPNAEGGGLVIAALQIRARSL